MDRPPATERTSPAIGDGGWANPSPEGVLFTRRDWPWLAAGAVLVALFAAPVLLWNRDFVNAANEDAMIWFCGYGLIRESLLRFHELAMWTPAFAGGVPIVAHPRFPLGSPMLPFVLVFGPAVGFKVGFAAVLVAGFFPCSGSPGAFFGWTRCRRFSRGRCTRFAECIRRGFNPAISSTSITFTFPRCSASPCWPSRTGNGSCRRCWCSARC
ncbi:MAG: hypothetical protein M5R36_24205 [Deltaproteobacteria bacterium]|nr:hypothetical protein [Deltaproteobacteria bacterium]